MSLDQTRVTTIIAHMNDDHADAVLGYVHRLGALPAADSAVLVALDAEAMTIDATVGGGTRAVRIAFERPLRDADDARDTLIALARSSA